MHRNNILQLLKKYLTKNSNEKNITERFINFVKENENCFERTLQSGHLTGSAWVLNNKKTHVLLTHHKKLDKWLQLGGHADGDPDILNVALREVEEESGLTNLKLISNGIFDLDAHIIPARKNEPEHIHYDVRFAFQTTTQENYKVSKESFDLAWVPIDEIHKITKENSLMRMVRKSKSI